jgi:hypothetical protein
MNEWKTEGPNRVIVCFDNIRLALYERDHLQQMEPFVWELAQTMAGTLRLSGYNVMMDDTHSSKWKRDHYKAKGGHGIYLNTPLEVCLSRMPENYKTLRDCAVRIDQQLKNFDPAKENIVVVDWKSLDK